MPILSTLSRYAADYLERRQRMRTYLEIASLPAEIQKDIGWSRTTQPHERVLRHLTQLGR